MPGGFHPSRSAKARLYIYLIALPIILIYTLVLAGCVSTSPGIPSLFLAEVQNTTQNGIQVRVAYFAICVNNNSTGVICASTFSQSPAQMASTLQVSQTLTEYGLNLQRALFPPFLAAAGILFILGAISLSLLRINSRPEAGLPPFQGPPGQGTKWGPRHLSATYILIWLSTAVALVVAYSTTLTLTSLEFAPELTQVTRGSSVEVLQWLIFSLSTLFSIGVVRIIRTYNSGARPAGPGPMPAFGNFNGGPPRPGPPPPAFMRQN